MGDHDEHSPPEVDDKPLNKSQVFIYLMSTSRYEDCYKNITRSFFFFPRSQLEEEFKSYAKKKLVWHLWIILFRPFLSVFMCLKWFVDLVHVHSQSHLSQSWKYVTWVCINIRHLAAQTGGCEKVSKICG